MNAVFTLEIPALRLRDTKIDAPTTAITTAIIVAMNRRLRLPFPPRDDDDDDDEVGAATVRGVSADVWKNASSTGDASVAP